MFHVAIPHAHVVSSLKYPHFFFFSLLQLYPVRSRFRHRHVSQGLSYPFFIAGIAPSGVRRTTSSRQERRKQTHNPRLLLLCLPTPLTLVSGGGPIIPLLVHQPAYLFIWPATTSLQWCLSTNPGVTVWCVCGCS